MRNKDQILLEKIYTEGLYSYDDPNEEDEMDPLYIEGEYWFDESGEPMYADGDYGDMDHEMYVMDRCAGDVLGWFDIERYDDELPLNLYNHIDEVIQIILQKLNITDEEKKEEIENNPYDAIVNYLKNHTTMKGPIEEIVYLAAGKGGDGREFAIREWGWSRVHQNNIEVKELTREQLKIVASGINRALEQEGVYGDEKWLRASQGKYNISTYTGKRYEIKLEDMEKGNVQGLERADIEHTTSAGTQQVRQMDVSQTPSFYKGHLGDSFILNNDKIMLESLYEKVILKENDNLWELLSPEKRKPMSDGEKRRREIFFRNPNESPEVTNDRIAKYYEDEIEDKIKHWKNLTKEQEEELRNHMIYTANRIREVGVAQATIESMRWYMMFNKRINKNTNA